MSKKNIDKLKHWITHRDMSASEVQTQFAISKQHIGRDVGYMQLTGLTEFHNPKTHPGRFYFQDGHLVLLYVSGPVLAEFAPDTLLKYLGEPDAILRSRAGKLCRQYVYPKQGVAFSASSDEVSFVEVFPPTSLEAYQSQYYQQPPQFIR